MVISALWSSLLFLLSLLATDSFVTVARPAYPIRSILSMPPQCSASDSEADVVSCSMRIGALDVNEDDFPTDISLWAMPPPGIRSIIYPDLVEFAQRPGASNVIFEPHVTVLGAFHCQSAQEFHEMVASLRSALNEDLNGSITCKFEDRVYHIKDPDTPGKHIWNQACCLVLDSETTDGFQRAVHICENALADFPTDESGSKGSRSTTSSSSVQSLERPHMSIYYGRDHVPDSPSKIPTTAWKVDHLELWKTSPTRSECDVHEWRRMAIIDLPKKAKM